MTRQPDRRIARSQARITQGACVVLLCAGAAVGVLGLPGVTTPQPAPEELDLPVVQLPTQGGAAPVAAGPIDAAAVSARFAVLGNSPKLPEEARPVEETPTAPAAAPNEIRFIGTVALGPIYSAILVDNTQQRFAKRNDMLSDGSKIVDVTADTLTLEDSTGKRRSIEIAARTGEAFSRAAAANVTRMAGMPAAAPAKQLPSKNNAAAALAMQKAAASGAAFGASAGAGRKHAPGSPERFDEIMVQLKQSGQFQDENALQEAAKVQFEMEIPRDDADGAPK